MLFAILVADGVLASGFTLLHDTLSVAEVLRGRHDPAVPEIRIAVVGEQPIVRTGSGLAIPTTAHLDDIDGADVVVVPALGALDEAGVLDALDAPGTSRIASALAIRIVPGASSASSTPGSSSAPSAGTTTTSAPLMS